jgi:CRISPR-associated protein Csa1
MLILEKSEVDRRLKLLRDELSQKPTSEELRGWRYDCPPVQPLSQSIKFGVGELAGRYCETLRDIYLKRVLNVRPPPTVKMVRGVALHEIIKNVIFEVKKFIFNNPGSVGLDMLNGLLNKGGELSTSAVAKAESSVGKLSAEEREIILRECLGTYNFLLIQAAAKYDQTLSKYRYAEADSIVNIAVPPVAERKVDGSLVGLSNELSVDIYTPYNAIIDIKTGEVRRFHPLTAAGYAIAVECDEGIPIDYGFILYLKFERKIPSFMVKYFVVGDELRREFLEFRDEALEIVESGRDPGYPSKCPEFCPYYPVCRK